MKPDYIFGTAQGINERADFLVSLAGPRGGSAAAFGLSREQAEELRNNIDKALNDPLIFVGDGQYRLRSECSPADIERAKLMGSAVNEGKL